MIDDFPTASDSARTAKENKYESVARELTRVKELIERSSQLGEYGCTYYLDSLDSSEKICSFLTEKGYKVGNEKGHSYYEIEISWVDSI